MEQIELEELMAQIDDGVDETGTALSEAQFEALEARFLQLDEQIRQRNKSKMSKETSAQ